MGMFFVAAIVDGVARAGACSNPAASVGGPFNLPLVGAYTVTSGFGMRVHPVTGELRAHHGVDLAMSPHGGAVLAMGDGVVVSTNSGGGGGNVVTIDHGSGLTSVYMHLASFSVSPAEHVSRGRQIGIEGSTGTVTGPHLHWEVRIDGVPIDPVTWAQGHGLVMDGNAPPIDTGPPLSPGAGSPGADRVGDLSPAQLSNAAEIITAGAALGIDEWTITVGVMTALGESGLENIGHGDAVGPDSRGLFQQRANGAWGSEADRMTPRTAATNFFRALTAVPGYHDLAPTIAAHRTQANADPFHYERFWNQAVEIVARLTGDPAVLAGLIGTGAVAGQCPGSDGPLPPPPALPCPASGSSAESGLRPNALSGLRCGAKAFPAVTTMYGVGSRGGPSDHPAGNAVDFMIEEYRTPPGRALGWQVAEWMVAHHQTLGVKYVIFDMQIWSASQADAGWRPYTRYGPDPDDNLAHRNHVHVSFY
jgi:hypothetical protein